MPGRPEHGLPRGRPEVGISLVGRKAGIVQRPGAGAGLTLIHQGLAPAPAPGLGIGRFVAARYLRYLKAIGGA
jgi:hypothetical protein